MRIPQMKITLINPRFPLSLWDFSLCRDLAGSAFPFPPLSLATLAGLTPRGHDIVICDENVRPVDMNRDADLAGITGYHIQKEQVFRLADAFRKRGVTVAIGGPLVQRDNLGECLTHADAVFLGEAEYTWPAFIGDLQEKTARPVYDQKEFVALSDSPSPRFDLLDQAAYSSAIIETSRGCPHSCEFCEIPIRLGKGSRTKSIEQVMREIRDLSALGVDSIFIIDDNFFGNRKRAADLLAEIERFVRSVDHRIYFSCQFTIDIARDDEILALLHRANVRRVFIGIETPRQASLAMANKSQNILVDLQDAVRRIQSHAIIVWGAFIVGFDSDDKQVFDEQLAFIQAASIPVAMVGMLQALPGTPLYERIKREGRFRDGETGGIRGAASSLVHTNIEPKNMTYEELALGFRYLVRTLYRYDNFAERLMNAIALGKKAGIRGRARLTRKGVATILRLLRYYLVTADLGRSRMFLKVILRTLMRDPRQLHTVLMHLVVYKHLKLFYEEATS